MSTSGRVISGSAASWTRIVITLITQVALVPIYLNYWDVETYGVWLAVQAFVALMTMLDYGHQTYMGFEFLRFSTLDKATLSKKLWSSVALQGCTNILQLLIVLTFIYTGLLPELLSKKDGLSPELLNAAAISAILQTMLFMLATSLSGMFVRILEPFGYLPRLAWWNVFLAIVTSCTPPAAIAMGADLVTTTVVLCAAVLVCSIPYYMDMFSLMKKLDIHIVKPSWSIGFGNFSRSIVLTGRLFLENSRQQGIRVVLAPLLGASGLAAFSTMRTGSNVALQGLNTITNPIMPDLMRFLNARDQERSEAAFGTIWIVVIFILAPAVLVLQAVIAPIFNIWTQGHIEFNPALFSLMSLSVLVYAVAQPAVAVVAGNNLLRPQLIFSIIAGVIAIGGIIVLLPIMGIVGSGIALVTAEVAAAIGYALTARAWLKSKSLQWPVRASVTAATSVALTGVIMGAMVMFPDFKYLICLGGLFILLWNFMRYWKMLPEVLTSQILNYVSVPVLKKKVFAKFAQFIK